MSTADRVPEATAARDHREPPRSPTQLRRAARASLIGTTMEWYDFNIYGTAAALVLGPQFFPSFSPVGATLAAFATFGVGFLARPLGGLVMGHFGDRLGRKRMLVLSLVLMGVGTTCIGLLPTYASIGVLAPILLVVLRFVQGIGVGGEWGGAVLMAMEHAPRRRRAFYSSFAQIGNPLGIASASLVFIVLTLVLPAEQLTSWGWRIPFLLSVVLVVYGFVLRWRVDESPDFEQVRRTGATRRLPIVDVARTAPRRLLLAALAGTAPSALGYLMFVYMISYGREALHLPPSRMLMVIVSAALLWAVLIPVAARLADRVGRRPVFLTGLALLTVWAWPFFALVDTRSLPLVALAYAVATVAISAVNGAQAALFAELFPTNLRYSGASASYQVGALLGGALAPFVATALFAASGTSTGIALYVAGLGLVSLLGVAFLPESRPGHRARAAGKPVDDGPEQVGGTGSPS